MRRGSGSGSGAAPPSCAPQSAAAAARGKKGLGGGYGGSVVYGFSGDGMQYLLSGGRTNVGVKAGRYYFEATQFPPFFWGGATVA